MPWQDRLKEAAYTPPGGTADDRIVFQYENVSRTTEKRTTAFSFPGINDSYIQDNGYGSRKYAMRCFFWGDDHDRLATVFEAALLTPATKKAGKLEHPLYGTFDVVPFGSVSRRDDLLTAANQSVIEVTFWTTTGVVYPTSEPEPKNEVFANIELYKVVASESYGDEMQLESVDQQQSLRGKVEGLLATADVYLSKPAEATEKVTREFRAWQQTINNGINVLVGNPVLYAQQVVNMLLAPARAVIGIQNRLIAYVDFIRSIFNSQIGQPWQQVCACSSPSRQTQMINDFRTADLNAQAALVAMALAAVETEFRTKPEALTVADTLLAELAAVAAWREQGYEAFTLPQYGARIEALDTGIAWQRTQATIAVCAGWLVQISFTVAQERIEVLDRARTIIDLASELYGSTDEYLDFIIDSNDLTGSEILALPKGAHIAWYQE